jgi:Ran GTPase-activating protein (RanGAP) involved in mRNA processing and transport
MLLNIPLIVWNRTLLHNFLNDSQWRMLGETCKEFYKIFQYLLAKYNYPSNRIINIPSNELCLPCIEYMIKKLNQKLPYTIPKYTVSLVVHNKSNKINLIPLVNIIKAIPENINICLTIKNNGIFYRYGIIGLEQEIIIASKQLARLDLTGIELSLSCVKLLADKLPIMKQLNELNVSGNYIGDIGIAQLAIPLVNMQYLTSLSIESICITIAGVITLSNMLKDHTIFSSNIKSSGLTKLNLSWNYFKEPEALILAPTFVIMTQLTMLSLNYNKFGPLGIATLASAFTDMTQLKSLSIRSNDITSSGVDVLGQSLISLTNLTMLDLEMNNLQITGCKLLTPILTQLTNLITLNLNYNNIEPADVDILKNTLSCMPCMQKLFI